MRYLTLIALLVVISCSKPTVQNDDLIGKWEVENYEFVSTESVAIITYKRVNQFGDKIGVLFEEDGVFKTWDFGWCGTPPLVYFFTEGNYSEENDLITLDIMHHQFEAAKMDIVELNASTLQVRLIQR